MGKESIAMDDKTKVTGEIDRAGEDKPPAHTGGRAKTGQSTPVYAAADQPEIGTLLAGKYRVLSLLGEGGMGSVYKVKHVLLAKDFALKTLNAKSVTDITWMRFQKEAKAAALLEHEALVKVHDFGTDEEGRSFFVMDLVEGETLSAIVKREKLPLDTVYEIFRQVCFGLGYAHSQGVVHRDIKPSNIMVANVDKPDQLKVKIVDFGIAKVVGIEDMEANALTRTGEIFGTPFYMSPEQCMGTGIDDRSDIYSLGCVLFETLAGLPPFIGDTALPIMMKHQGEPAPTLKEVSLGISFPADLERIVAKMLEKDPRRRYQNLLDVAGDLARVHAKEPILLGTHAAEQVETPKTIRRQKNYAIAVSAIVLIAAAFFAGRLTAPSAEHETKEKLEAKTPPIYEAVHDVYAPEETVKVEGFYSTTLPGSRYRVFEFPRETIGMLYFLPGTKAYINKDGSLTEKTGYAAKGVLFVENFKPMSMVVDRLTPDHAAQLKGFRADEIAKLTFDKGTGGVFDDTIQHIIHLTAIRELDLQGATYLTDKGIFMLNSLIGLEKLKVADSMVTADGIIKLKRFRNFTTFGIVGMKDTVKITSAIAGSPVIEELFLRNCHVTGAQLAKVSTCPNLTHLDINEDSELTDQDLACLANLHKLKTLEIAESKLITPKAFKPLSSLPLTDVVIWEQQWSPEQVSEFHHILPKCALRKFESHPSVWQALPHLENLSNPSANYRRKTR